MKTPSLLEVVGEGSAHAMGVAQGKATRKRIRAARETLRELEAFQMQRPRWMPFRAYRSIAESRASRFLKSACAEENREMWERLEGMAEGAGVRPRKLHLLNALEPMLSAVGGCTACPGACSAVAVRGKRSATGEAMIARNFDYLPIIQPFYLMRESRPETGFRAFEFTTVPMAGTVDGMNERGLCITYDYAFTLDEPATPAAPISFAISEALRKCETVEAAAELIAGKRRWGAGLLMLADATGEIASLELSSTRHFLRRPEDNQDAIFHTNAFSSEIMKEVQLPPETVYTEAAPTPLRGRRLHHSSEMRDRRFAELLEQTDVFGPEELRNLMADHGPENSPGDHTPCVHGSYWFTTATLQFFAASRKMRVSYSTACEANFDELSFEDC